MRLLFNHSCGMHRGRCFRPRADARPFSTEGLRDAPTPLPFRERGRGEGRRSPQSRGNRGATQVQDEHRIEVGPDPVSLRRRTLPSRVLRLCVCSAPEFRNLLAPHSIPPDGELCGVTRETDDALGRWTLLSNIGSARGQRPVDRVVRRPPLLPAPPEPPCEAPALEGQQFLVDRRVPSPLPLSLREREARDCAEARASQFLIRARKTRGRRLENHGL
jgi:hypothetical protein